MAFAEEVKMPDGTPAVLAYCPDCIGKPMYFSHLKTKTDPDDGHECIDLATPLMAHIKLCNQ